MYFWNTKKLAEELKNDTLPEKSVFWYLVIYFIFLSFQNWSQLYDRFNPLDESEFIYSFYWQVTFSKIFGIIIMFLSLIICWNENKKGDNKDFLKRYFCLHFPVTVKILLFLMLFFYFVGMVSFIFDMGLTMMYIFPFFWPIISLVVIWRVWYYIRFISST